MYNKLNEVYKCCNAIAAQKETSLSADNELLPSFSADFPAINKQQQKEHTDTLTQHVHVQDELNNCTADTSPAINEQL